MNHYTVLLLRPDYLADEFGKDTYLAHVTTNGVNSAALAGQRQAWRADDGDDAGSDPTDYHVLLICRGHQEDLKP